MSVTSQPDESARRRAAGRVVIWTCLTTATALAAYHGMAAAGSSLLSATEVEGSSLLSASGGRAAPGDKGRGGLSSTIQQETMRVLEAAQRPATRAARRAPRESAKIPKERGAVRVVAQPVVGEATSTRSASSMPVPARQPPVKWNWKQWQEEEKRALIHTARIPISRGADKTTGNIQQGAHPMPAAASTRARVSAASTSHKEQSDSREEPAGGQMAARKSKQHQTDATIEQHRTLIHAAAKAKASKELRSYSAVLSFPAHKPPSVHAAAGSNAQNVPGKGDKLKELQAAKSKTSRSKSKWNWAQWQEEAKQLLLHPGRAAGTAEGGQPQQNSQRSVIARASRQGNVASPRQAVTYAANKGGKAPAAATTYAAAALAKKKALEVDSLPSQVKALEKIQHNTEALSKVEAADASIKTEIKSVMKHVNQLSRGQNKFTGSGNGVPSIGLSKATLKAMQQAQKAGREADDAAERRAKEEALRNYDRMRDKMFLKDAQKQLRDEHELEAQKNAARAKTLKRYGGPLSQDDERLLHTLDTVDRQDESRAVHHARPKDASHGRAASVTTSGSPPASGTRDTHATHATHATTFGFLAHLFG